MHESQCNKTTSSSTRDACIRRPSALRRLLALAGNVAFMLPTYCSLKDYPDNVILCQSNAVVDINCIIKQKSHAFKNNTKTWLFCVKIEKFGSIDLDSGIDNVVCRSVKFVSDSIFDVIFVN